METSSAPSAAGQLDKYKRLLSLARSSLEANQASLAAKDAQIAELVTSVDELRRSLQVAQRGLGRPDESLEPASIPRSLLRRVDMDELIWILVEYEGSDDDGWVCFSSEAELGDYIQRVQGVPLVAPPRSLTPAESHRIEADAQAKVDQIVEEFRRYKLRSDIARKQKDAEARQALLRTSSPAGGIVGIGGIGGGGGSSGRSTRSTPATTDSGDDAAAAVAAAGAGEEPALLYDTEAKWRSAYEKAVRENEQLRNRGGDMLLATQWRERYDALVVERDDLLDKLRVYSRMDAGGGGGGVGAGGKSIEQAFLDLKDEYKVSVWLRLWRYHAGSVLSRHFSLSHPPPSPLPPPQEFRWRMTSREQQRQSEIEDLRAALANRDSGNAGGNGNGHGGDAAAGLKRGGGSGGYLGGFGAFRGGDSSGSLYGLLGGPSSSSSSSSSSSFLGGGSGGGVGGGGGGGGGGALGESKLQYIRHMLLQYLSCKEPEVKLHIENALLAIFRFGEAERALIEERKKSEAMGGIEDIAPGILENLNLGSLLTSVGLQ